MQMPRRSRRACVSTKSVANVKLSKAAQRDLAKLLKESLLTFGAEAAARRDAELREAFAALGEVPTPGTPYRGKVKSKAAGVYWLPVRAYVIFYRLATKRAPARVVRISHVRQLSTKHLR